MDTRNFAIGVLSVTAVVLFVGLLVVNQIPEAQAIGQTASGGDYLVATGQYSESTEFVYVIDAATGRLLAYEFDVNAGRIQRIDGIDLENIRKEVGQKLDRGRDDRRRPR